LRFFEILLQFFDGLAALLLLQPVHKAGFKVSHRREWFGHGAASITPSTQAAQIEAKPWASCYALVGFIAIA
jgi:hypothetical protein